MGQKTSKLDVRKKKGIKKLLTEIPPDSPLGVMLANWDKNPCTRRKDKVKMIQFCIIEWAEKEIRSDHVY